MNGKKLSESKTVKYQVISTMIAVVIGGAAIVEQLVDPQYVAIGLLVLKAIDAGINTYLRVITSEPIAKN